MKTINTSLIFFLSSFICFGQLDSIKPAIRLNHFPSGYDKEPGFYSVADESEEYEVIEGADGNNADDAEIGDYFGEFDDDSSESHRNGGMINNQDDLADPFAETDEVPVRDKSHTWFAEDKNIVIARSHYKNGRLSGRYRKWTDDGKQLITDMAYKKGKTQGKAVLYHANGQVKSKTYYNKGKLNGSYVRYDTTGNKLRQGFYISGKPEGEQIHYHTNGEIKTVTNYKKGIKNGVKIEYDANGKETSRTNYIKGLKEGDAKGVKYKKTRNGKIYKFRISETDNDVKLEKERVK